MKSGHRCIRITVWITVLVGASSWANPKWAVEGASLQSKNLTVMCRGVGPSSSQASKRAIESCLAEAANFIRTDVIVKTLVVQTEKDSAIHDEVRSATRFEGLVCTPGRHDIEDKDQVFTVYQECRFDLTKVKIIKSMDDTPESVTHFPANVADKGEERLISVSSAPPCESVIVEGSKPSITRCQGNPVQVRAPSGVADLIVRAEGYLPKRIRISPEKEDVHATLDPK